jgi:hypothetical protein
MAAVSLASGALVLNCPGCGTQVADGTSICPKCDYIIDNSFLSSEPPPDNNDDEATGAAQAPGKAAPSARPTGSGSRPSVSSTGVRRTTTSSGTSKSGSRPAIKAVGGSGSKPGIRAVSKPVSRSVPAARPAPEPEMELDDAEPRKPLLPPTPASRGYASTNNSGKIVAPEELISDARAFVGELTHSDKIAFAGACVAAVSCFLPWKETATDGDVLGLMSTGVGTLIGAAAVIGAIFVRVRRTMPKINPMMPWYAQIGMAAFCVLYTLFFIKASYVNTMVPSALGNQMVMNSSPSFGSVLGLLSSIGAVAGSLMGMREHR